MGDPISTAALFGFLNSAFKFSEYAVKLYSVDSENGVFVRMIQRVRLDLEETERLVCSLSVKSKLIATPGKLPWIKGVILSTKGALNEIGRWVERVRSDKEGYGSVSWENKIRWVFNDNEKLVNRRMELGTCHQALSTVLAYLAPLEQAATPLVPEPPKYQDATFLDELLSPRQRRRKARDLEKRDEGTSKETQKPQIPTPATTFQSPLTHNEAQRKETVGAVNNTILSYPRHHSLPTPFTSERPPFVSSVSSPETSRPFSISSMKPSFTMPAVQEWSSDHSNPQIDMTLSPGSVSDILARPLPSTVPISEEQSSNIMPSTTTSWIIPQAHASSTGDVGQVALPASSLSLPPWQKTLSTVSLSTGGTTQGTTSQHYTDTTRDSLKSPGGYGAYSLPTAGPPILPPQYSPARPFSPVALSPTNISSCQAISSDSSCPPRHTLQAETQNFSATNTLGPINVFELYSEPQPETTVGDYNRPLNESLHSQQSRLEHSQSTYPSLYAEQNGSPRLPYLDSAVANESLAEVMASLLVQRPGNQVSVDDVPNSLVFEQSQSGDSFKELSTTMSWEQTATSRFEMPSDSFVWPNFSTEVPAATDELYIPRQRAATHTSIFMEKPPPSDPGQPQSQHQHHELMASWSNTQAHVPQAQPKYAQDQYQAYSPPSDHPSPVLTFRSTTSSYVPSPMIPEQEHWAGRAFTPPPIKAATPVQVTASITDQGHPLSRSLTAGEARRRNQKTLLNLIGRGGA